MKRNVELDTLTWPKEDLKRILTLNYPGCKSAMEAVKDTLAKKSVTDSRGRETIYQVMKATIEELTLLLKDFDYDSLPSGKREELQNMKAQSIEEIRAWRDAWKDAVLKSIW